MTTLSQRGKRSDDGSYLAMGVVEGEHAVVVAVLGLDRGRGQVVAGGAELAELGHGVAIPWVHVGGV